MRPNLEAPTKMGTAEAQRGCKALINRGCQIGMHVYKIYQDKTNAGEKHSSTLVVAVGGWLKRSAALRLYCALV